MKLLLGRLGVILIGLVIFGYAEVWGEDWRYYGDNEMHLSYYDAQSITRPSKNIVRVWVKSVFTEKGVMDWVGRGGKQNENLSHAITLWEINCSEKKYLFLSGISYDNKGKTIYSYGDPSSQWEFIIPETMIDFLYKEVCK